MKLFGAVLVLGILALITFLVFAPAYVEKGQNNVVAHIPYPVTEQNPIFTVV